MSQLSDDLPFAEPHVAEPWSVGPGPTLASRVDQLETELAVLRFVVARVAQSADPRARIAVVKALTGAPGTLTAPGLEQRQAALAAAARLLLKLMSG